jgi:hypothetical protein
MAPERWGSTKVYRQELKWTTEKAEVYGLAFNIAYFLFYSNHILDEHGAVSLVWGGHHMSQHRNWYRLEMHRQGAGTEIVELIRKGMSHDPAKRPTLVDFTRQLKAWKQAPKKHSATHQQANKKQKLK